MRGAAECYARRLHHNIDLRTLLWTFKSINEDGELQESFEGIPGLCGSKIVPNALRDFIKPHTKMLSRELIRLTDRTLSSNLASESVKQNWSTFCSEINSTTRLYSRILANCTTLYIRARVSVSPTVFSIITDDRIPISDDAITPYPRCTDPEHQPAPPVEELQFDEPPLEPSPNPAHTPTPSATIIPPSPGPPPTPAIFLSNPVASLHFHASVPASSSRR